MKKIAFVILLFSVCNLFAQNNRYDIKSGIVEYDILGTTNSKDHTFTGSSILYFKDFGNLNKPFQYPVDVITVLLNIFVFKKILLKFE